MAEYLILYLLLPLGVALGWALARAARSAPVIAADTPLEPNLAPVHADITIATLTEAGAKSPAAAELNLSLGALFRKRGELDRAMHLHESVLQIAGSNPVLRPQALYELGQDYIKAGLLDRAETALQECVHTTNLAVPALEQLLSLYEQLSSWEQALNTAQHLEALKGQSLAAVRCHYLCEIGQEARAAGNHAAASKAVARALSLDGSAVRPLLLHAAMLAAQNQLPEALEAYMQVPERDPRFVAEVLPAIQKLVADSGQPDVIDGLIAHFEAHYPADSSVWLARAARITTDAGRAAYLAEKLGEKPSWKALVVFLEQSSVREAGVLSVPVSAFKLALGKALERRPRYRCSHCGFTPSLLFWRCPSCKQWGSVYPAEDVL